MTLAGRLVGARTGPGTLSVNTASMFVPFEDIDAKFFEALLNSQFANAWYKLRDVNRDVRLNILANLPIVRDEKKWREIAEVGNRISKMRDFQHRYLDSCNIRNEDEVLASRFPKNWAAMLELKRVLDSKVFELYDLSPRQRSAVTALSDARVF